ncbi:hypothetical protein [Estrella lausannensis]|uniref:hypothetical protein n=1 Tax=Estrella lausannensis TaxID=483423 RepID=UPI00130440C9|nr:hypothetical protein [Estrella lausannensis]
MLGTPGFRKIDFLTLMPGGLAALPEIHACRQAGSVSQFGMGAFSLPKVPILRHFRLS